jgi:hypothetical protein
VAFDQVHGEPQQALERLADVMDRDDVTMPKACEAAGLVAKTLQRSAELQLAGSQHLDGYGPIESGLPRAVDDTHAAASEFAFDLEAVWEARQAQLRQAVFRILAQAALEGAQRAKAGFDVCSLEIETLGPGLRVDLFVGSQRRSELFGKTSELLVAWALVAHCTVSPS